MWYLPKNFIVSLLCSSSHTGWFSSYMKSEYISGEALYCPQDIPKVEHHSISYFGSSENFYNREFNDCSHLKAEWDDEIVLRDATYVPITSQEFMVPTVPDGYFGDFTVKLDVSLSNEFSFGYSITGARGYITIGRVYIRSGTLFADHRCSLYNWDYNDSDWVRNNIHDDPHGAYKLISPDVDYSKLRSIVYRSLTGIDFVTVFRGAALDALKNFTINTNNYANAIECISTAKAIINVANGKPFKAVSEAAKAFSSSPSKETKKLLSSAWMSYRYQYLTTKSDVEEFQNKWSRSLLSGTDPYDIISEYEREFETAHQSTTINGVKFCVGLPFRKRTFTSRDMTNNIIADATNKFFINLNSVGLNLSLYNAWDLVPLSFVVDWVLPIGDCLEDLQDTWYSTRLEFAGISKSYKVTVSDYIGSSLVNVSYYKRWFEQDVGILTADRCETSTNTQIRRLIDGAAMLLG